MHVFGLPKRSARVSPVPQQSVRRPPRKMRGRGGGPLNPEPTAGTGVTRASNPLLDELCFMLDTCVYIYYLRIYTYIHTTVQILVRLGRNSSVSNIVRLWPGSDGSGRQGGNRGGAGAITVMDPGI